MGKFVYFFMVFFFVDSFAGEIASGPMLGYTDYREQAIWLQTDGEASVELVYWTKEDPSFYFNGGVIKTSKENAFIAQFICDSVQAGKEYFYKILIDSKEAKFDYPLEFKIEDYWWWRTDPPSFKIALGSCAYINDTDSDRPGKPYGQSNVIFESIAQKNPDLMLWLGDNLYFREMDWFSRTGMIDRYSKTRALPEMQKLLAKCPNYAIWDDHDFGPNNSDRSFRNKKDALDAFKMFWPNPSYGFDEIPGCMTSFQYSGIDFILLDNRYHRTPNERVGNDKTLLGKEQLEWLIDKLAASKSKYKIVAMGGQFLNPTKKYETYANLAPQEREYILEQIEVNNIKGVIFLSGDRHHTELSHLKDWGMPQVYDFTVSPLTSGTHNGCGEGNFYQVPETCVDVNNFAIMEFTGSLKDRKLKLIVYDKDGIEIWSKEISI